MSANDLHALIQTAAGAVPNPSEPNLLRALYPYAGPPRLEFAPHPPGPALPADFYITDTTFRDGQQARTPYTPEQITTLFDFLHRLSGPEGVIRQAEFFLYGPQDRRAVEACLSRGYRYPQVTAWIRAVAKDFELVRAAGIAETGILTSCSDYHIYLKLGLDRAKAMRQYLDVVRAALEAGVRPRCHFEDVTRADIHGFVVPFAQALMALGEAAGIPVRIRLCDTMGYGVPWAEAALPRSVPRLVRTLIEEAGVPGAQLEWHGHNDFHKGEANAQAAWLYGCAAVNGTLLGFGERTGNTPIEGLIFDYLALRPEAAIDTRVVTEIARYFESELGYQVPPMTPFVGRQFNVTAAGIHADGLIKNEEIYNIFDTEALLDRPLGVNVTDKAGAAGVAFWVNRALGLKGEARLDKRHPGIAAMTEWVREQYAGGRTTSLSEAEMAAAAARFLPEFAAQDAAPVR
ncbi:MAG TPA: 2-isopropylmalate synthase [Limnochordia bacterium]|nr:2-isopropylmalate synthase [Limnochordia bacterium]